MEPGAIVAVDAVRKRLGGTEVVAGLSFDVAPGEILGFLGPNGAGKTTTMRMILDIVRPDAGTIRVFGGAPGIAHRARIGYLPEERGLYRDVPAIETLTYLGTLRGFPSGEARRRGLRLLGEMGLGDAARKSGAQLSRGMHQKVQLIAAILHEPELLIVDEPFGGLDPVNSDLLKAVLRDLRARGTAVIMSTHDMADAQALCDRILLIDRGRRLLYGPVGAIRDAFADGAVSVRGRGLPGPGALPPSATERSERDGTVRYLLRPGARAADLFRELAASGAEVERFQEEAPELGEIFVRAVAGDPRAEAVR